MNPEQTVSTATVARYLLLTPRRVRELAAQGVLEKAKSKDGTPLRGRFKLFGCVNAYIRFLRSRSSVTTGDDYTVARARRMSALASIEELRSKRIHGELHHGRDVEFVMTQMFTAFKARTLAAPEPVRPWAGG